MIQFDDHIFEMGWWFNHQLVMVEKLLLERTGKQSKVDVAQLDILHTVTVRYSQKYLSIWVFPKIGVGPQNGW